MKREPAEHAAPNTLSQNMAERPQPDTSQPLRLKMFREFYRRVYWGEAPQVSGKENLEKLDPKRPVLFATTHITKEDVPAAAAAVSEHFEPVIVVLSGLKKSNQSGVPMKFAGNSNFLPVDSHMVNGRFQLSPLNPKNFDPMVDALKKGKAIVIAAHNPVEDQNNTTLSENPGYGAIYLAQRSGAQIVPVAVELKSEKPVKRFMGPVRNMFVKPTPYVTFGEPYTPEPIDISQVDSNLRSATTTKSKRGNLVALGRMLKDQSTSLMEKLSQMVPEQNRGKWQN